jgi:hypothetical protein
MMIVNTRPVRIAFYARGMKTSNWMSWEGGFDLVAATAPNLPMPNIIVHVARMVHTPVGSAPAGMVLVQTNPTAAPEVMGFVSTNAAVGAYFGPKIFAGTPFENAPVHVAQIAIDRKGDACSAKVTIGNMVIEAAMSGLAEERLHDRAPMPPMVPFAQRVIEAVANKASVSLNGKGIALTMLPVGISGGPATVWSTTGLYSR